MKEYMPPKFEVKQLTDDEIVQQLKMIASDMHSKGIADNLSRYIKQRSSYIQEHAGKYVQVTDNGIQITDKTELDKDDLGFDGKLHGLLLKVGSEIRPSSERAMYAESFVHPVPNVMLPISFGSSGTQHWITGHSW